ncbi:DUF1573 domain-containing protein [Daejeonella lutea]|uniref:DUF1573 domain-containing protein n=1 Tax=Daejeonella lutea TaxID=572036 RepID=A0A1T5AWZ0_9SPHI|nr:DUF1573 domain-containing protein [Daejeonella lutea]SKB39502.1 Protein of unknown function [Daejeonella lutea]
MKKIILSLACVAVLASCSNQEKQTAATTETPAVTTAATTETAPADAPVFKFVKESYDFGQITDGEKVSYDFKFSNTGKSPLIITSATATCGCTVPDYPKEPVAPGAEGVIRVVFDSSGKLGMQNKVITITANTVPEITQLNILGNVVNATTAK